MKNHEVLEAHIKVIEKEPRKHNFGILKDLVQEVTEASEDETKLKVNDDDQRLFFGEEFCDSRPSETKLDEIKSSEAKADTRSDIRTGEKDFDEFMNPSSNLLLPSQLLIDDSLFNDGSLDLNADFFKSLVPSTTDANQDLLVMKESSVQLNKNPSKKASDVSKWFNLFSELDPLNEEQEDASKNLHAA